MSHSRAWGENSNPTASSRCSRSRGNFPAAKAARCRSTQRPSLMLLLLLLMMLLLLLLSLDDVRRPGLSPSLRRPATALGGAATGAAYPFGTRQEVPPPCVAFHSSNASNPRSHNSSDALSGASAPESLPDNGDRIMMRQPASEYYIWWS